MRDMSTSGKEWIDGVLALGVHEGIKIVNRRPCHADLGMLLRVTWHFAWAHQSVSGYPAEIRSFLCATLMMRCKDLAEYSYYGHHHHRLQGSEREKALPDHALEPLAAFVGTHAVAT